VICSRALGDFSNFLTWAASPSVSAKQVLLWLGGRDLEEVRAQPSWTWSEPLPIPKSLQRFLLTGTRAE
jgi:hypothetical protein